MVKVNKLYIFLVVMFGVLALLIGGTYPYSLFYISFIMVIFGWVYISFAKRFMRVEVAFKRDYYSTGDSSECITKINYNFNFPVPYIKINSEAMKHSDIGFLGEITSMSGDENKWVRSKIHFRRRGLYNLGKVEIQISDIFKIFTFVKFEDKSIDVKVYPKLHEIKSIDKGGRDIFLDKFDKNSSNEEQFTIRDVRKYRMGDSLKKVHWKVSAKLNELFVKNTESISGEQYVVLVDMNKSNYSFKDEETEEKVIELAASVLDYLSKRDINVDVHLNKKNTNVLTIKDRQGFYDFMDYIVMQKSDGELDMVEFMHYVVHHVHKSNKIIVITADLNDHITGNIINMRNGGFDFAVFYCLEDGVSNENRMKLESMTISCTTLKDIIVG